MLNAISFESRRCAPPQDEVVSRRPHSEDVRRTVSKNVMLCAALAMMTSSPVHAEALLFEQGDVMCFGYVASEQSCRTVLTVLESEEGERRVRSRAAFLLYGARIEVKDLSVSRLKDGSACRSGFEGEPQFTPDTGIIVKGFRRAFLKGRRNALTRGQCNTYRRCGDVYDSFVSFDDQPVPKLHSRFRYFAKGDPAIEGLTLEPRVFGKKRQPVSSPCEPLT